MFWVSVPIVATVGAAPSLAPTESEPAQDQPLQGTTAWYGRRRPSCAATGALCSAGAATCPWPAARRRRWIWRRPATRRAWCCWTCAWAPSTARICTATCARAGSSTLVVLVTAERDTALRRQAAERGWGFLLKPVCPSALRALISQRCCCAKARPNRATQENYKIG